jgi:Ni,Fe-hydrogenase III small subunit
LEWRALLARRFQARLKQLGVCAVGSAAEADVVVVTGLLTARNLDAAMLELDAMPAPSVLVAVGDAAIDGGIWAGAALPGLARYPLGHYADVSLMVPGSPPTPQALMEALGVAARLVTGPGEKPGNGPEDGAE